MIKARRDLSVATRSRRVSDIVGLCLFFVGAASLLWLVLPEGAPAANAVAGFLRLLAGSGAFAVPVILMFVGSMFLVGYERFSFSHSTYGSILFFLAYVTWRHIATVQAGGISASTAVWDERQLMEAGGAVGGAIGTVFLKLFGIGASYLFLGLMACVSTVLLVDKPFIELLKYLQRPAEAGVNVAKKGAAKVGEKAGLLRKDRPEEKEALPSGRPQRQIRGLPISEDEVEPAGSALVRRETETTGRSKTKPQNLNLPFDGEPAEKLVVPNITLPTAPPEDDDHSYRLPPITLLKEAGAKPVRSAQEAQEKIRVLEETLSHFKIEAQVVEIAAGPTVTRYEIQLAPGIKVSRIVALADNLAMALAAIDVRVEAPIPGKSAIGIEVPNKNPGIVTLREMVEHPDFQAAPSKLTFALGKDVAGEAKYADLTRMPHMLVAGSTNSGKSVCLNALIASLVYRATPREVQMLMIDPKRVELSLWDGIPHLMHPVVKDVRQAAGVFRAAIKEMDRRYDLFAKMGTRNIDGYNQKVEEDDRLPYLVMIVDELADLMMQCAAEIETSICRLAQLARATGIHLVIATQRPSVDVITGLIKANISSRIAFAVSSQVDSRTILDANGAERLIGRGDMLFLPIDAAKPARIQGCFLSEQETNALVEYLKSQEPPNYSLAPVDTGGGGGSGSGNGAMEEEVDDELFESCVKLVVTNGQASTSMLQRRFKIGYTRAARIVDMMQERGIVGPLDGAKPREILVSREEIDQMFRTGMTSDFRERDEF
jgi:S-DNA-T family DNA segregation ATPase FtsK/SpoIIIE